MALKLESRKFKKVHGSSRKFTKVRSTFAFCRIWHLIPISPCSLEDFTSSHRFRLLYAAWHCHGTARSFRTRTKWKAWRPAYVVKECERFQWFHQRTNASSINALYLAFSAISSASSSDTFLIASKLTKEAKLGDLLTRGYSVQLLRLFDLVNPATRNVKN